MLSCRLKSPHKQQKGIRSVTQELGSFQASALKQEISKILYKNIIEVNGQLGYALPILLLSGVYLPRPYSLQPFS